MPAGLGPGAASGPAGAAEVTDTVLESRMPRPRQSGRQRSSSRALHSRRLRRLLGLLVVQGIPLQLKLCLLANNEPMTGLSQQNTLSTRSSSSRGVGRRVGRIPGATTRRRSWGATTKQPTMVFPESFVPNARRRRSRTCRGPIVRPWTVASPIQTRSPTPCEQTSTRMTRGRPSRR